MDDVNEHMDELFRRAAENYPLKTESGDFNKVLASLSATANENEEVKAIGTPKRNPIKSWFFLILFMFPWIYLKDTFWKFNGHGGNGYGNVSTKNKPSAQVQPSDIPSIATVDSSSAKEENGADQQTLNPIDGTSNSNKPSNKRSGTNAFVISGIDKTSAKYSASNSTPQQKNFNHKQNRKVKGETGYDQINDGGGFASLQNRRRTGTSIVKMKNPAVRNRVDKTENDVEDEPLPNELNASTSGVHRGEISGIIKEIPVDSLSKKALSKKQTEPTKVDSANKTIAKKDKPKPSNNRFLYVGIMAGPDASMIKFQTIKSAGLSTGIVVGYQFSKKWAIESGAFWDKKFYYTKGKYFDPKHLYLPTTAKLNYVTGGCNMWELPLNMRYNFKPGKTLDWFAAAGVSSYIIKAESYDYNVTNNMQTYFRYRKYTTTFNNWLGAANFSFGFNHALRKSTNFRVESYFKLPLKKMGTGNLDVISTGINLGITQKLF